MSATVSLLSVLRSSLRYHQNLIANTEESKLISDGLFPLGLVSNQFSSASFWLLDPWDRWHAIFHLLLCHLRSLISLVLLPHEFVGISVFYFDEWRISFIVIKHRFWFFNHLPSTNLFSFVSSSGYSDLSMKVHCCSAKADSFNSSVDVGDLLSTAPRYHFHPWIFL